MTKNIKNIICVICASLIFIVALCLPFVFKPKFKTKNLLCTADTSLPSYSYFGSSLFFRSYFFKGLSMGNFSDVLQTDFSIVFNLSSSPSASFRTSQKPSFSSSFEFGNLVTQKWSPSALTWHRTDVDIGFGDWYFSIYCRASTLCDFNFVGCYISSFVNIAVGQFVDDFRGANTKVMYINYVRYFGLDASGNIDTTNFIEFAVPFVTGGNNASLYAYTSRTYYFTQVDSDSASYSAGYNDGYSVGNSAGESSGYKKGYSVGDNTGYSRGYNAGVADSNDYTFLGLMSSVVDAPIKAFTGLFNFEVFGVNLSDFVLGVSTLCIIIFVVRKLLL